MAESDSIVVLREPISADADAIRKIRSNQALQEMLMAHPPSHYIDDVDSWLIKKSTSPDIFFWLVAKSDDNVCVGFVQIVNIRYRSKNGFLGICISPDWQGNGYGGATLRQLLTTAAEKFHFHKILLEVREDNEMAINFYLKHGFNQVGTLKEHYLEQEKWYDVVVMEQLL